MTRASTSTRARQSRTMSVTLHRHRGRGRVLVCVLLVLPKCLAFSPLGGLSPRQSPFVARKQPRLLGAAPRLSSSAAGWRAAQQESIVSDPAPLTPPSPRAYYFGMWASSAAWVACAISALCTYKPHRIAHNAVGVAQALSILPLLRATGITLSVGAWYGRFAQLRRLNLGLAFASIWSAIAVVWAPSLTAAAVRGASDPHAYPLVLRVVATAAHLSLARTCLRGWAYGLEQAPSLGRVLRGVLGSVGRALSLCSNDDPDCALPKAPEYAFLFLAFSAFALGAVFAAFPLATLPTLLGKRLARAAGAWMLLAAVVCYELAMEHAHSAGDTAVPPLRRGLMQHSLMHLAVAVARPLVDSVQLYPAALACIPATIVCYGVYVVAAAVASDAGPAETKIKMVPSVSDGSLLSE